jgi:predicted DNA-binding transcriptional regulator AlpA
VNQPLELLAVPSARLRERLVRQVMGGWSRRTLYRRIELGQFPAPEKDGPRCAYWRSEVVRAELASSSK